MMKKEMSSLGLTIFRITSYNVCYTKLLRDFNTTGEEGLDLKKTGQTSMNFLQVEVSPREAALGGAITSLSQGIERNNFV